jgi:hypothetical protein
MIHLVASSFPSRMILSLLKRLTQLLHWKGSWVRLQRFTQQFITAGFTKRFFTPHPENPILGTGMKVGKIVFPRKTHPCGQGVGFAMLYATAGLKPLMAADGILPRNIGVSKS